MTHPNTTHATHITPEEAERRRQERHMFPIQATCTCTGKRVEIPWEWAEIAYAEYARRYGTSQSLERLAERHGFGMYEIIDLLVSKINNDSLNRGPG